MIDGWRSFGFEPVDDELDADMARRHTERFRDATAGTGVAPGNPRMTGTGALQPIQPPSPGLGDGTPSPSHAHPT